MHKHRKIICKHYTSEERFSRVILSPMNENCLSMNEEVLKYVNALPLLKQTNL